MANVIEGINLTKEEFALLKEAVEFQIKNNDSLIKRENYKKLAIELFVVEPSATKKYNK